MLTDLDHHPAHLVLFDGVCSFCNASVRFILHHERHHRFYFASLQSDYGIQIRERYQLPSGLSSIVFIEQGHAYSESEAVLRICRKLNGLWPLLYGLKIIPRCFRDYGYRFFAHRRYKWFGYQATCQIPGPEFRTRIIS